MDQVNNNKQTSAYDILGCSINSTAEQVRKEYFLLCLKYHPDKNKEHYQRHLEVNEAYEILKEPESRANYDRFLSSGLRITYRKWCQLPDHHRSLHWNNTPSSQRLAYNAPLFTNVNNDLISKFRKYEI